MKKARLLALLAIMALPLTGCGGGNNSGNNDPQNPPVDPGVDPTKKTLSSIEITTDPTKTEYSVGEELDLTGMVVTAHYSDGSSEVVTGYNHSNPDMSTAGQKEVTISFEGKTATFNIVVSDGQVEPGDPDWSDEMKATLAQTWPGLELPYFLNENLGNVDIVATIGDPDYKDHFEFFGDKEITSDDLANVAANLAKFGFEDELAEYRTPEAQAKLSEEDIAYLEWHYPMELKYENSSKELRYFDVVLTSDKADAEDEEEQSAEGLVKRELSADGEEDPIDETGDDPVEPGDDPVDPVDPAEEEGPKFYAFALDPYAYSWSESYAGILVALSMGSDDDEVRKINSEIVPFVGSGTYKISPSDSQLESMTSDFAKNGYVRYYIDDVSKEDLELYAETLLNQDWEVLSYDVEASDDPESIYKYYRTVSPDEFLMVDLYWGPLNGQLNLMVSFAPEYTDLQREIASGAGLSVYEFSVDEDEAGYYEDFGEFDSEEDAYAALPDADALAEAWYKALLEANLENVSVLDEFNEGYGRFLAVDANGKEYFVEAYSEVYENPVDYIINYETLTIEYIYEYIPLAELEISAVPEYNEAVLELDSISSDLRKYDFSLASDGSFSAIASYDTSFESTASVVGEICTLLDADEKMSVVNAFNEETGYARYVFKDSNDKEFLIELSVNSILAGADEEGNPVYLYYSQVKVSEALAYPDYVEAFAKLVGADSKYDFLLSSNGYYYFEKDSDENQFNYAIEMANKILADESLKAELLKSKVDEPVEYEILEGDDQWAEDIQLEMYGLFGELLPFVALNEETLYGGLDDTWADYGEYSWVIGDDNETNLLEDYGEKLVEAGFEAGEDSYGDPCYTKTVASGLDVTVYATYYEATDSYDAGNEIYVSFETDELPNNEGHAYYDIAVLDSTRIVIEAGYDASSDSYYYFVALLPYSSQPENHEYTSTISTALGFEEDAFNWYGSDKAYQLFDKTGKFAPADEQSEEDYFQGLVATIATALGEDWAVSEVSISPAYGDDEDTTNGGVYTVTFTNGSVEITVTLLTDHYGLYVSYLGYGEYNLIIDIDPFVEAPADTPVEE